MQSRGRGALLISAVNLGKLYTETNNTCFIRRTSATLFSLVLTVNVGCGNSSISLNEKWCMDKNTHYLNRLPEFVTKLSE